MQKSTQTRKVNAEPTLTKNGFDITEYVKKGSLNDQLFIELENYRSQCTDIERKTTNRINTILSWLYAFGSQEETPAQLNMRTFVIKDLQSTIKKHKENYPHSGALIKLIDSAIDQAEQNQRQFLQSTINQHPAPLNKPKKKKAVHAPFKFIEAETQKALDTKADQDDARELTKKWDENAKLWKEIKMTVDPNYGKTTFDAAIPSYPSWDGGSAFLATVPARTGIRDTNWSVDSLRFSHSQEITIEKIVPMLTSIRKLSRFFVLHFEKQMQEIEKTLQYNLDDNYKNCLINDKIKLKENLKGVIQELQNIAIILQAPLQYQHMQSYILEVLVYLKNHINLTTSLNNKNSARNELLQITNDLKQNFSALNIANIIAEDSAELLLIKDLQLIIDKYSVNHPEDSPSITFATLILNEIYTEIQKDNIDYLNLEYKLACFQSSLVDIQNINNSQWDDILEKSNSVYAFFEKSAKLDLTEDLHAFLLSAKILYPHFAKETALGIKLLNNISFYLHKNIDFPGLKQDFIALEEIIKNIVEIHSAKQDAEHPHILKKLQLLNSFSKKSENIKVINELRLIVDRTQSNFPFMASDTNYASKILNRISYAIQTNNYDLSNLKYSFFELNSIAAKIQHFDPAGGQDFLTKINSLFMIFEKYEKLQLIKTIQSRVSEVTLNSSTTNDIATVIATLDSISLAIKNDNPDFDALEENFYNLQQAITIISVDFSPGNEILEKLDTLYSLTFGEIVSEESDIDAVENSFDDVLEEEDFNSDTDNSEQEEPQYAYVPGKQQSGFVMHS